jgi:membrane fusion protein (multidrug efflux system)
MPLVTISDVSRIKLDFTVPETQLGSLRAGLPVEASAAAYGDEVFRGTIESIDPAIDPSSRAVLVRAVLPNPGARLKPGMLLSVRVRVAERMGEAVPEFAVAGRGEERFVYVVGPESKARKVPVTTGLGDAGLIEVSGLPPGARVIGEGVIKVADGMKVRLAGKGGGKRGKRGGPPGDKPERSASGGSGSGTPGA